jgi:hypothetical protein
VECDQGMAENGGENYLLSPNQGRGSFKIRSATFMSDVLLNIYDISGRIVQEEFLDGYETDIFVKNVKSGIYLFKFVNGNHSEVLKVVIK